MPQSRTQRVYEFLEADSLMREMGRSGSSIVVASAGRQVLPAIDTEPPPSFVCGLGSRIHLFSRLLRVHSHYGPVTRNLPKGDLVDGLQSSRFPSTLPSKLRGV